VESSGEAPRGGELVEDRDGRIGPYAGGSKGVCPD